MQTLGLTMAIAAPDAGAESAVQPNAMAPSDAGAVFESLMIVAGEPNGDLAGQTDAALPLLSASPVPNETLAIPPASQALASDMEQMVQALAITAEVVALGMAARTTPIREIILTVEAPASDVSADMNLPQLSIVVPPVAEPSQPLKISEADPATNLDPALVALMPQLPQTPTIAPQADTSEIIVIEPLNTLGEAVVEMAEVPEMPVPQPSSNHSEEAYGPWRAEIHGPILNLQRELVTTPVHVATFDAPEPNMLPDVSSEVIAAPEMLQNQPIDTELTVPNTMTDMPLRVVTIHLPMKAKAPAESGAVETIETRVDKPEADLKDNMLVEPMQPIELNMKPADFIGPQMIQIVPADLERSTQAQALDDTESSADALHAPRPALPESHVILVSRANPEVAKITPSATSQTRPSVLIKQDAVSGEASFQAGAFDVAAVVETLHKDADLSRLANRQVEEAHNYDSLLETKISNSVGKTSSRSSGDIRDLIKLGVRDIELTQGTGSAQDMNVRPQPQINELTGATAATRALVSEAFVPSGTEANTSERRAQAHDIRMRAIERQVVAAVRDGADTIRMQLYPPGLGQIIIRLTMDGSKLKLTTSANSRDAADNLRSIEGDLRDALSVGGLELTGFDVSEDGEGDDKNRKHASETENNNQQSRSAKSGDFALDMNA